MTRRAAGPPGHGAGGAAGRPGADGRASGAGIPRVYAGDGRRAARRTPATGQPRQVVADAVHRQAGRAARERPDRLVTDGRYAEDAHAS